MACVCYYVCAISDFCKRDIFYMVSRTDVCGRVQPPYIIAVSPALFLENSSKSKKVKKYENLSSTKKVRKTLHSHCSITNLLHLLQLQPKY